MAETKRKGRGKIKHSPLLEPALEPNTLEDRDVWLERAVSGFVSPSAANREIYRVILETLWPEGHGIPGPIIERESIRAAVDTAKGTTYRDPFRRLRELQGEEGFLGIHQQGTRYQLVSLQISPKKPPRTHLPDRDWTKVVAHYHNLCEVCGDTPGEDGFQQDHKVPRDRAGSDDLSNWQPLCDSCNIAKSISCRGCTEDCSRCSWAYPEFYKPLKIPGPVIRVVREYAEQHSLNPDKMVVEWLLEKTK